MQTHSEKEHLNDENDETTHNALLSPNVEAVVGICLWTASVLYFILLHQMLFLDGALEVDIYPKGGDWGYRGARACLFHSQWKRTIHLSKSNTFSFQLNLVGGCVRGEAVNIDEHRRVFGISYDVKWDSWRAFFFVRFRFIPFYCSIVWRHSLILLYFLRCASNSLEKTIYCGDAWRRRVAPSMVY